MNDCIFCKIVNKEIPAKFVYEDDQVVAFEDIHPAAPVHILIVPKKHVEHILALAGRSDGVDLLGAVLKAVPGIAAKAGVDQSGFRLINNCGHDGGQTIPHVHFHLIGGRAMGEKLL
jgi:histidine triad (HIT) family protein